MGAARTAGAMLVGQPLFTRRRLQDMLTIVVVTSIVPSNPDTSMIESILASYVEHEPLLLAARKIIVCDRPKTSATGKRQYKSGIVLAEDYAAYEEYIERLRRLAAANRPPFTSTRVHACDVYRGFCFAVKDALMLVETELVMIVQHDRALRGAVNALDVCETMLSNANVHYVGFATSSSINHAHRMRSKYQIDVGPGLVTSLQGQPLCPLLFWYDSTHIAKVRHYLDFAFGWHRPEQPFRLCTGDFFEDKLGQFELKEIKSRGMDAHAKYGTYVLEADEPLVQHWHGRKVGTSSARTIDIYTRRTPTP